MLESDIINVVVGPLPLLVIDESVLEESESLMSPKPDQPLHVEGLQGSDGLADAPHPPGHLPGGVDVVGLHVLGKPILGQQIELHHGIGQWVSVGPQ